MKTIYTVSKQIHHQCVINEDKSQARHVQRGLDVMQHQPVTKKTRKGSVLHSKQIFALRILTSITSQKLFSFFQALFYMY